MKDSDLKSKLDALSVPDRDPDYWEKFSGRVLTRLKASPEEQPRRRPWMPGYGWEFALALGCAAVCFFLCQSRLPRTVSHALLRDERELRATLVQFPDHVGAIMRDEHGLHRLVEDQ